MTPLDSLRGATRDRLAAQWIALGGQLAGDPDRTLIDLEALIVITAELAMDEARVREVALDWCLDQGRLINGSRLRTVAAELDVDPAALGTFAGTVAASGGPRWKVATGGPVHRSRQKVIASDLSEPSRLAWRLRAAFGVNARADILVALAQTPERPLSLADLARLTRFTKRNVSVAVTSMALAGVVEVDRRGNVDRVRVAPDFPLRPWLRLPRAAAVDWTARWSVVRHVLRTLEATQSAASLVRIIELQAAVTAHAGRLVDARLPELKTSAGGLELGASLDGWLAKLTETLRDLAA